MTSPVGGLDPSLSLAALQKSGPKDDSKVDKDAFMKLLVAQMKYQNPTAPADGKEYLAQLAQFTMVEKLEQLSAAQSDALTWQKNIAAEGMLGRTVTGTGANGTAVTDQVVGLVVGSAGAQLELRSGGTLSVDQVTRVVDTPSTGSTAPGA